MPPANPAHSASLATDERSVAPARAEVTSRTHRRRALVLFAVAAWNVLVWGTRLRNLLGDTEEHTTAFLVVHVVLYVAGFGTAAVLTAMGLRMRREATAGEAVEVGA